MSRDNRDQRGGHRVRRSGMNSCGCCPVLNRSAQSSNRTERDRVSDHYEHDAEVPR